VPGCGALVPDERGPTHRYILSAPGCWRIYGELQGRYGQAGVGWRTQKLPADACAVQHPGEPGPQSSQSVVVHLVALCRRRPLAAALSGHGRVASGGTSNRKDPEWGQAGRAWWSR
jgi:hypothetical protein